MPIEYKHGMAEVEALAQRAGKAQAARDKLQMNFQKEMAMMNYQFEIAKMQRAKSWELEKMEIASRNDFALQEKERVDRDRRWNVVKNAIQEADGLSDEEKQFASLNNMLKIYGGEAVERLTPYQEQMLKLRSQEVEYKRDPVKEMMKQKLEQAASGQAPTTSDTVQQSTVLGQAALKQTKPLSQVPPVDIPQTPDGKFIVIDPSNGEQWSVTPRELPEYIEKGFVAQPLSQGLMEQIYESNPIPGIGFGGAGYNPFAKPKQEYVPYDPGARIRKGLAQVGEHL